MTRLEIAAALLAGWFASGDDDAPMEPTKSAAVVLKFADALLAEHKRTEEVARNVLWNIEYERSK